MIWYAASGDVPELLERLRRFHSESPYSKILFDEASARETVEELIAMDAGTIIMHGHGAIGGLILPMFFNKGRKQAIELFWHADKDGADLLTAFEDWAHINGADSVVMGSLTGKRQGAVDRFYRIRGYRETERLHTRALQW